MKLIHICELCGKTFDDYDDCLYHEHQHNGLTRLYEYELLDTDRRTLPVEQFDTEHRAPSVIFCKMPKYKDNSFDYADDAYGSTAHEVVPYVRATGQHNLSAHANKLEEALLRWSAAHSEEV